MGFMVFKSTGLGSRFQCKNRFWKICTESRDIGQNVSNFAGLVWKADFGHFFGNIFGLGAHFSKPIFALKSWVQAGWFEYHEPHNLNNFFSSTDYQITRAVVVQARLKLLFVQSLSPNFLEAERRNDPCSDPGFELHNHLDYARQSCFSVLGL